MIRELNKNDTSAILKHAPNFWAEIQGDNLLGKLSLAGFSNFLCNSFAKESIIGWGYYNSAEILSGILFQKEYTFFTNENILAEVFWWADPSIRSTTVSYKLIKCAEQYAAQNDIDKIRMSCMLFPQPERLARFYKKIGYHPIQQDFVKKI